MLAIFSLFSADQTSFLLELTELLISESEHSEGSLDGISHRNDRLKVVKQSRMEAIMHQKTRNRTNTQLSRLYKLMIEKSLT